MSEHVTDKDDQFSPSLDKENSLRDLLDLPTPDSPESKHSTSTLKGGKKKRRKRKVRVRL